MLRSKTTLVVCSFCLEELRRSAYRRIKKWWKLRETSEGLRKTTGLRTFGSLKTYTYVFVGDTFPREADACTVWLHYADFVVIIAPAAAGAVVVVLVVEKT